MTKSETQSIIRGKAAELGRFPKIGELIGPLGLPRWRVSKLLQKLVTIGWLVKVGTGYGFPADGAPVDVTPTAPVDPAPEASPKPVAASSAPTPSTDTPDGIARFLPAIRWSFLFIGIIAGALAAWYIELWFAGFLPLWAAWLTATLFVGFSIMSLELALFLFSRALRNRTNAIKGIHWVQLLLAVLVLVLWVIVVGFSVATRVAGQYNQWVAEQVASPMDPAEVTRKTELTQIEDQVALDKTNISTWQPLLDTASALVQKAGADLETKQTWGKTYLQATTDVATYTRKIAEAQKDIETKGARQLVLLSAAPKVQTVKDLDDAYTWAGRALHVPKAEVQFWANLFPAIFLDVIAPVGFTVFFFLSVTRKPKTTL
jgi:hypothetical protein